MKTPLNRKQAFTPLESPVLYRKGGVKAPSFLTGFTLIEVILAITVAAVLIGAVALTLNMCFDAYMSGEREIRANKFLDGIAEKVMYGDDAFEGIQAAMEILSCGRHFITYVPLWKDTSHEGPYVEGERFVLDAAYKHGSGNPIGEISRLFKKKTEYFESASIEFKEENDKPVVVFKSPIPKGSRIQIVYWPDTEIDRKAAAAVQWDAKDKRLTREYKNNISEVRIPGFKNMVLSDCAFRYFDSTGREVLPEKDGRIKDAFVSSISGVELHLKADVSGSETETVVFLNLRNTRSGGGPVIIKEGTEIRIPNSRNISVFSVANISGSREGNVIELVASPDDTSENDWKITLEMAVINNDPVVKSYTIEYPPGKIVYKERIFKSTSMSLDLLKVGQDKYDYGYDSDEKDVVKINSDSTLKVTRMETKGAALYMRP